MSKVCVMCGMGPAIPAKPDDEPEDCEHCGGQNTVRFEEEDEDEE